MASETKFHDRDTLLYNGQPVLQHVVFVARASVGRSGSKGLWFNRATSSFRTSCIMVCPLNPPNLSPQYGICNGFVHGGTASFGSSHDVVGRNPGMKLPDIQCTQEARTLAFQTCLCAGNATVVGSPWISV